MIFFCPAKAKLNRLFAVVRPRDNRGEREQRKNNRKDDRAEVAEIGREHRHRHQLVRFGAGEAVHIKGREEGQRGQGADDKGVKEHLKHAPKTLLDRLARFGRRVRDNRGAETCFVGEHAARHTLGDDLRKGVAHDAAAGSLQIERLAENHAKGVGNIADMGADCNQRHDDKQQRHKRHKHACHLADALNAADDDDRRDCRHDNADHQLDRPVVVKVKEVRDCLCHRAGDFVRLHAAHADCRKGAKNRGAVGEPLPAQTVGDIIESAAGQVAVLVALAEVQTEHVFGVVCHHAEERGNPHPEHRAGTSRENRGHNAHNVAGADGARDRGGERLKLRDRFEPRILFFAAAQTFERRNNGGVQRFAEVCNLQKFCADSEQNTGTEDQNDNRPAPNNTVEKVVDRFDAG